MESLEMLCTGRGERIKHIHNDTLCLWNRRKSPVYKQLERAYRQIYGLNLQDTYKNMVKIKKEKQKTNPYY